MKLGILVGAAAALMSAGVFAEDYVQAKYASVSVKSEQAGVTFKGSAYGADLRYDFEHSPIFGTLGLSTGSVDNSDFGLKITVDETAYGFGFGYAFQQTKTSEVYVAVHYAHADASASFPGIPISDTTSDQVAVGVGGHVWFNDLFRGYGGVSYVSASHKDKGPGLGLGVEARVSPSFGLFLEYSSASIEDDSTSPRDTVKSSLIGGGIRIPFGGNK